MIFVTLGTQDKSFKRLLEAIDREIDNGTIKDKVIVQAGCTKYESKNMEIFDLIAPERFNELISEADLVITHGGAGSILTAVKNNKKVIAAPRLKKYKEHTNDHQKEIIEEFVKEGYILGLNDFSKLGKMIEKSKNFKPKKFTSNTENMIDLISKYIEEDNHTSWYNKTRYFFYNLIIYSIYFLLFDLVKDNLIYPKNFALSITTKIVTLLLIGILFISYLTLRLIVYKSKNKGFISEVLQLLIYMIADFAFLVACSMLNNNLALYFGGFLLCFLFNHFVVFKKRKI